MSKKQEYSVKSSGVQSPTYLEQTREEFTGVEYLSKIIYKNASRYKNLRTLQTDDGKIIHETWFQKFIDYSNEDQYYIVTLDDVGRLDIISNRFYSTPRYWWVIAMANYIMDPFEVTLGTQLRIPPITSLYNKGGVLGG